MSEILWGGRWKCGSVEVCEGGEDIYLALLDVSCVFVREFTL